MYADFYKIENLISELESVERAQPIMASLAWSFAMSVGQLTARLNRVHVEDDPTYGGMSDDQREETTRRLEARREEAADILSWAVRGANPEFVPTGADVASRLQEGQAAVSVDEETIEMLAEEMGVTVSEVKRAQAKNAERMAKETSLQAEAARLQAAEIVNQVDMAITRERGPDAAINLNDAIKIVDRIADKAADYAENSLAAAMRQRRARRRQALAADRQILVDIEQRADQLLDTFQHERDAVASEAEPA